MNNLISNALRYHDKSQDNPYVKIIAKATEAEAQVAVEDNGQGIDEKHLEHIFTLFYRANKTTEGSGIGLYIVKEALEKLGGKISVTSKLSAGTKFTITIPNYKGD